MTSGPNRAARPVIPVDYEDMKTGFQSGKAAALADWSFRKEQREFKVIVNRLRARKWAKENPARANANARVYQAKPGIRAKMNQAQNGRRRRVWLAAVPVVSCRGCGVEFCPAFPKRGKPRAFCTDTCKSYFHWRARRDRAVAA